MKIYISADMEGATGVVVPNQVIEGRPGYEKGRRLMLGDVNAAIAGAYEAGATEAVVNDAHFSMTNISVEDLDSRARLISGRNKPLAPMEGLDRTFDAVFFVAYHARVGTERGVINHTYLGRSVREVRLNGHPAGEVEINAGIAAYFGVPVVLVTGDDRVVAETRAFLPEVEAVVVKEGIDRYVANLLPPEKTHAMIRDAARRALERHGDFRPRAAPSPATFEIDFMSTAEAAITTLFPTVSLTGPRTVSVSHEDYIVAFKAFYGCLLLGRTVSDEMYG
jgi:D-amino peptidase